MRLLAAVDLSGSVEHYRDEIVRWASRLHAVVDLVYVRPGPEAFPYLADPTVEVLLAAELEGYDERSRETLAEVMQWLPEERRGQTFVDEGRAAPAVAARAPDYDAVLVATHGRTGFPRAWLGSVAEEVVRRCPVPVIVVRL